MISPVSDVTEASIVLNRVNVECSKGISQYTVGNIYRINTSNRVDTIHLDGSQSI